MRRFLLLVLVMMIVFAMLSGGCDSWGKLSRKETQRLYDEIDGLVRAGNIWGYDAEAWLNDKWKTSQKTDNAVSLLQEVAKKAFDPDNQEYVYGRWFHNKKKIQAVYIGFHYSALSEQNVGEIFLFEAEKFENGNIRFSFSYDDPNDKYWHDIANCTFRSK